jgi:hypothetical protein
LKITVQRIFTPPFFAFNNGHARRRSGLSSFFKHLAICVVLAVITLLIADGGGFVFLTGAVATATAIGLLLKRVFELSTQLIKTTRHIVR